MHLIVLMTYPPFIAWNGQSAPLHITMAFKAAEVRNGRHLFISEAQIWPTILHHLIIGDLDIHVNVYQE